MNDKTLARELVRARLADLAIMKKKLDKMSDYLEKMMAAQLEFQALIEACEEHSYELSGSVGDGDLTTASNESLSFDALLEMLVNKLSQRH
jgi:hypothetical protein